MNYIIITLIDNDTFSSVSVFDYDDEEMKSKCIGSGFDASVAITEFILIGPRPPVGLKFL